LNRLPIRVRLTAAFALAMVLVLAGAGLFVYLRLRADLDDGVNGTLRARVDAVVASGSGGRPDTHGINLEAPDDSFVQVVTPACRVVDAVGGARRTALSAAFIQRAANGHRVQVEKQIPGIDGNARLLARRADADGTFVVIAGQSLGDRDEALSGVVKSFVFGGAAAILIASIIGYLLASAGLAPVEAMRRRAREVSLSRGEERLPLPEARDEIRRLGETLNEMLDRLRQSFERERRFVADASHELRTPIAVIKTELEGALRTGDFGPEVRPALVAAVEECDRLVQLAEDLLVIARSSEGELPVRSESIEVRPLLEGIRDRFVDRAGQHGRTIAIDVNGGERLSADPLRVRQALGNLVDNALRYGSGEIVLRSRSMNGGIELEVTDEGSGFAPDIAARAFDRFARGNGERAQGGAGLGLSIVRAIAEAHGGEAEIVAGQETTVRILLPSHRVVARA
jgi:signal transduction histidine kinase